MTGDKLAAERRDVLLQRAQNWETAYRCSHDTPTWRLIQALAAALRSAPDCPQKDSPRVGEPASPSGSVACASRLPEGGFDLVDSARIVDCYLHGDIKKLRNIAMAMLNEKRISATYVADTASHWIPRIEGVANHIKAMPRTDLTAGMELELRYCAGALAHLAERQVETNLPSVQREARETLADGSGSQPTVRKDGARSTSEGSEWRPIETAPKDGTTILAAFAGGAVLMTRWYVHYLNGAPNPHREPEWEQREMYGGMGGYMGPLQPTHWMPLPPPPESKPAAGSGEAPPVVGVNEVRNESTDKSSSGVAAEGERK
jgi:hypothetical protein